MWDFKFSRRRVWSSELSSGMYCRVKWLSTDVSEVRAASIIIPDDGGSSNLWNVDRQLIYTELHPRRQFWIIMNLLLNFILSCSYVAYLASSTIYYFRRFVNHLLSSSRAFDDSYILFFLCVVIVQTSSLNLGINIRTGRLMSHSG
jgi:hypothetical protein